MYLHALQDAGVSVWIGGGCGADELRCQTRDHSDLDLVLDREELVKARQAARGLGFAHDAGAQPGAAGQLSRYEWSGADEHDLRLLTEKLGLPVHERPHRPQ